MRRKTDILPPAILLCALFALAGCRPTGAAALEVECQVFYRSSPAAGGFEERTLTLDSGDPAGSVEFDDLAFNAQYLDDAFEGRALSISVTDPGTGRQHSAHLYQMDPERAPSNEFIGGHGFTGLAYAYHPTSSAEMQFFCLAR